MLQLMLNYIDLNDDDISAHNNLELSFSKVTQQKVNVRGNIYKIFDKMAELPLVLGLSPVQEKLMALDFNFLPYNL